MTIEELVEKLTSLEKQPEYQWHHSGMTGIDHAQIHRDADNLLLEFIDSEEVTEAFENLERWYE